MYERYFKDIPRNICGIYKITNLLNNKVYIGQSIDIRRRWAAHWNVAQNIRDKGIKVNSPIEISLSQHNFDNFKWEIIEECPSNMLDEREKYWIQYYNSYLCGYNATLGGQAFNKIEPSFVREVELLLISSEYSFDEISLLTGVTFQVVSNINRGISWRKDNKQYPLRAYTKSVIQYDLYGQKIAEYETVSEAAEAVGTSSGSISAVCLKTRQSCKGYIFRYSNEEIISQPMKSHNSKVVVQKDLQGNEIARYANLSDAAKAVGCTVKDHIGRVCRGERKTCKGFKWEYLD